MARRWRAPVHTQRRTRRAGVQSRRASANVASTRENSPRVSTVSPTLADWSRSYPWILPVAMPGIIASTTVSTTAAAICDRHLRHRPGLDAQTEVEEEDRTERVPEGMGQVTQSVRLRRGAHDRADHEGADRI